MNAYKNILVVDDEPGYRVIVNRKLKEAGYHTILVQNAEEALAALWEKVHISLVLLDIRLPVINGLHIFEIIRKEFPDKKVIVVSVLQKDDQRFLIYDADDYYDKSEDLSQLVDKIEEVFKTSKVRSIRDDEKRNSRRVPVNVLATCQRCGQKDLGEHFLSYTKDLSLQGGKFVVSEDMKVGQHFTAALELPVNFLPLLIDCEVRWIKKSDKMEAGVKFVKLDSSCDEEKLKNYLSYV